VLKHWLLSRRFLRNRQRRNGFWAVDRLLRNFGGVFRLDGNLDSSGKVELVRLHLKKCLKNRFIVDRANEARTQCFAQGIGNGSKIARGRCLMYACSQFLNGLTRSTLHGSPELETFPDDETGWMKMHLHERHDLIHCKIVDFPRRGFLCSKV